MILGYTKAAKPTIINWMKRRIRLTIDNIRGQRFLRFVILEVLFDDGDVSIGFDVVEVSSSILSRRLDCINVRRIIIKQIADTANIMISGKIKRNIRSALELSRLKLKSKIMEIYFMLEYTVLDQNIEEFA